METLLSRTVTMILEFPVISRFPESFGRVSDVVGID